MAKSKAATPTAKPTNGDPTRPATVTDGDIARRAYGLYLGRACEHGHDLDDWMQAERELRAAATAA